MGADGITVILGPSFYLTNVFVFVYLYCKILSDYLTRQKPMFQQTLRRMVEMVFGLFAKPWQEVDLKVVFIIIK